MLLLWAIGPSPAAAHGFGPRYDLPIPLPFYLAGAGATVALSFAAIALFLDARATGRPPLLVLSGSTWLRCPAVAARTIAVAWLILAVLTGFLGPSDPGRNLLVVTVWIVGWVGIAFASAFVGDVWRIINPFAWLAPRRVAPLRYPERLGAWPALCLFMIFAWMELIWAGRDVPRDLAVAVLIYAALTLVGMGLFGRETWLARGELFGLVFGIFARFAPLCRHNGALALRPPAAGLLPDEPLSWSMTTLVIALLATVTFDGLLETALWARVDAFVLNAPSDSFLWTVLKLREDQALRVGRSVALPLFVLLFLAAYLAICAVMAALTAQRAAGALTLARWFVLSLVPIAIAYHVAHYFSFLIIGVQYLVPILSDPLGRGWDLFGTAGYQVDIGAVGPRTQWTVAVIAVVAGHVIACWLAHATALRVFADRRAALMSQLPILVLMVGYTMLSLWILAQPIVDGGA